MTSRRLNLLRWSLVGVWETKILVNFGQKLLSLFCENHKKLSNLPLSPHSILQNWVDYLKVTSLRDNSYYPKMRTSPDDPVQQGLLVIVILGNPRTKTHASFQREHFYWEIEGRGCIHGQGQFEVWLSGAGIRAPEPVGHRTRWCGADRIFFKTVGPHRARTKETPKILHQLGPTGGAWIPGQGWKRNYSEGENLGAKIFESYQGIGLHANGHHGKWRIGLRYLGSHEIHLPKIEFKLA